MCGTACLQSLTIDVSKLKCIVRLADMMLCGVAVGMLLEGVGGLQGRLASHAPLLVEPGFSPQGVQFQPEGAHMLKVAHSSTGVSHCTLTAHLILLIHCLLIPGSSVCSDTAHTLFACCVLAVLLSDLPTHSLSHSLTHSLTYSLTHSTHSLNHSLTHSLTHAIGIGYNSLMFLQNIAQFIQNHASPICMTCLVSAVSTLAVHTCALCP